MKFIVDMPLSPELAEWLRQEGHEAVHAFQSGLGRASDEEILEWARKERSIVITADLDYPRLLALSGSDGPGVILFRGGNYSEKENVERLRRVLAIVPDDELSSAIIVIEKHRIRRRRLPL
jgi:predicted nuclease of predicted toxin-antitoxin system